ncbi:hypothetical protein Acsp04_29270 [Actinomadura sp. NBRC 104425]|uniref:hypothetical protein n=1 Tax=Actinomadura sp. NBRC 104425 TaxID=3032204 RepID=UPI0024A4BEA2|nr:hypothetical protein [Actinomadura sp. NBRC 104425]GLZ12692.1 hypothetical protein Acsp04_29270 [Actinomadura sp. NBRC 104425]
MARTAIRRHAMAFLVVPALALTACGGGDDGSGADAAPPTVSAAPSGATSAPAPGSPSASAATATPGSTPRAATGAEGAPRRRATPTVTPSAYKTLAACLEKQGVKLPDPGQATAPPPGFDPVKAQDAFKTCMESLQTPGGGSTPR